MSAVLKFLKGSAPSAVERIVEIRDEIDSIREPQQRSDMYVELQRLRGVHEALAKVATTDEAKEAAKDAAREVSDYDAQIRVFEVKHAKRLARALELASELTVVIRDAKVAKLPSLVASVQAGQTALRKMDEARKVAADELAAAGWAISLLARNCGGPDPGLVFEISVTPAIDARARVLLADMIATVSGS